MREGVEEFTKYGTAGSKGTKVFALGGKVNNVGLVEVPMGTTLRELVFDIGGGIPNGKRFKAIQPATDDAAVDGDDSAQGNDAPQGDDQPLDFEK